MLAEFQKALLSRKWSVVVLQQVPQSGTHHRPEGPPRDSRMGFQVSVSSLTKWTYTVWWILEQHILHTKHKFFPIFSVGKNVCEHFCLKCALSPYHTIVSGGFGELLEVLCGERKLWAYLHGISQYPRSRRHRSEIIQWSGR